jgi:hypothetical protein
VLSDIALIVTALGVLGVKIGLRQSYRERLRQFEAMYVERYRKILDQLSLEAVTSSSEIDVTRDDEKAIRSYLILCEDELQMRRHGYIADSAYRVWADGMREQLKQPMFEMIWAQVEKEAAEHRTFPYEYLRNLLSQPTSSAGDPQSASWIRRRMRGLAGISGV